MKLKTSDFPKKISLWLLNRNWLWFSTKVPFKTWDSMDIDKTIEYYKGYKHFIFRGCVACNKMTEQKKVVLRDWFLYNREVINKL
jgi:hypothetical protein